MHDDDDTSTPLSVKLPSDVTAVIAVGEFLVSCILTDGSVHLFDALTDGEKLCTLDQTTAAVCAAATAATQPLIQHLWIGRREKRGILVVEITAQGDRGPSSWSCNELRELNGLNDIVTCVAASRDRVVSHGSSRVTCVWDSATMTVSAEIHHEWAAFTACLIGPYAWFVSGAGTIIVLDLSNSAERDHSSNEDRLKADASNISCIAWIAALEEVWLGTESGSIEVWDPWSHLPILAIQEAHQCSITAIGTSNKFGPCHLVWSASQDGSVLEWDARTHSLVHQRRSTSRADEGYITAVAGMATSTSSTRTLWYGGTDRCLTWTRFRVGDGPSRREASTSPAPARDRHSAEGQSDREVYLLECIEALETDLMRSKEVYATLEARLKAAAPGPSSSQPPDDEQIESLRLQLQYYEKRIEELENRELEASSGRFVSPGKKELRAEMDSTCEAEPAEINSKPSLGENDDAARIEQSAEREKVERALKLLEGRYEALLTENESLELKADDYKHIAKEATVRADDLEARIRVCDETVDRMETELLSLREQLLKSGTSCEALEAQFRSTVSDAHVLRAERDALDCHVESLYESIDCLHADIMALHASQQKQVDRWTSSELAAVEGLLLENDSIKLQLRLLEHMLATQHRQLAESSRRESNGNDYCSGGVSTNETLTACFLALREVLDPVQSNAVMMEALQGDVQDEAHATELIVRALASRLPRNTHRL